MRSIKSEEINEKNTQTYKYIYIHTAKEQQTADRERESAEKKSKDGIQHKQANTKLNTLLTEICPFTHMKWMRL